MRQTETDRDRDRERQRDRERGGKREICLRKTRGKDKLPSWHSYTTSCYNREMVTKGEMWSARKKKTREGKNHWRWERTKVEFPPFRRVLKLILSAYCNVNLSRFRQRSIFYEVKALHAFKVSAIINRY